MVLAACFRIAFRELDVAGTFQMIHGSDVLAVGTQDFHVFLDLGFIEHCYASIPYRDQRIRRDAVPTYRRFIAPAGTRPAYVIRVSWSGGCGLGRRC
jgi:hypothetical protein